MTNLPASSLTTASRSCSIGATKPADGMMSEGAQYLVDALRKGVWALEERADDLAFLAERANHPAVSAALYALARMQRVEALELQGQIAALRVQYGMVEGDDSGHAA